MGVVILTGFSCTGKTTLINNLKEDAEFSKVVQTEDTDKRISQSAGGNIYRIYLDTVKGEDRKAADEFITAQELNFLKTFEPEPNCIIAAGPILPTRKFAFKEFVDRTNAKCIWLTISPPTATKWLLNRQNKLAADEPEVSNHPAFGSWNVPHLMEFSTEQQRYVPTPENVQVSRVAALLKLFEPDYRFFANKVSYFVEKEDRKKAAEEMARTKALH